MSLYTKGRTVVTNHATNFVQKYRGKSIRVDNRANTPVFVNRTYVLASGEGIVFSDSILVLEMDIQVKFANPAYIGDVAITTILPEGFNDI